MLLIAWQSVSAQSSKEKFAYDRQLTRQAKSFMPAKGLVPDEGSAIAIATAVATPIYGLKQIDSESPLRADLKGGVWLVIGTMHCNDCEGGTLVVQIKRSNGEILFISHTK